MEYIKKYENFQSDTGHFNDFSIYQYFEDLKGILWGSEFNEKQIKFWSDHFIGEGVYDKVEARVINIFEKFKSIDLDYINDRMYDVWDELPYNKPRNVHYAVIYGDYMNYKMKNVHKYNGRSPVYNFDKESKMNKIISILISILSPTLFYYGRYSNEMLRSYISQKYVMDKKWQCVNFNIDDYAITSYSTSSSYNKLGEYSVDKVIDMYRGSVVIEVGESGGGYTGGFDLLKLEEGFDKILPSILPDLDYEDTIWDLSRGTRQFDTSKDFFDYTLKILLKE